MRTSRLRYTLVIGTIFLAAASVAGIVTKTRIDLNKRLRMAQQDDNIPPILSKVHNLTVIKAYTNPDDKPSRRVYITVRNDSDKGIEAITIKSDNFQLIEDNGLTTDNPSILIEPHSTYTIEIPAENFKAQAKIIIAGVLYADKTEDGLPDALGVMHRERIIE